LRHQTYANPGGFDMNANLEKERDDDDGIDPYEPKKNNPFEEAGVFERAGANQVAKWQNH
jgi:hypothetical protein